MELPNNREEFLNLYRDYFQASTFEQFKFQIPFERLIIEHYCIIKGKNPTMTVEFINNIMRYVPDVFEEVFIYSLLQLLNYYSTMVIKDKNEVFINIY